MNLTIKLALFLVLLPMAQLAAHASDGALDTSFGSNGLGLSGITDALASASKPLVQPDGKIVICGTRTSNGSSGYDFFVARFNANGTLDTTFSGDGKMTVDFDAGSGADVCTAVALQADGKIVLAGYTSGTNTGNNDDFAIARLNSDGTLDTTFGAGTGKATVAFNLGGNNADYGYAVAIQTDGKIVVAGTVDSASNGTDFGIVRLNTDGTRDALFNLSGKVSIGFDLAGSTTKNDSAASVAIDTAGNVVIGGSANKSGSNTDFAVARLLPNGQPDSSFATGGRATVAFDLGGAGGSNADFALSMAIQRDGKIVLAGYSDSSSSTDSSMANFDMSVARLDTDGSLDSGFGFGGKTLVSFDLTPSGNDLAYGIAEQTNGKLVLAGAAQSNSGFTAAAARLNADGSLDNQFGAVGKLIFDFGLTNPSNQRLTGMTFQGEQIIAAGWLQVPGASTSRDDFVVRLKNDLIFADQFE